MKNLKNFGEIYYLHSIILSFVLFFFLLFSVKGFFLLGSVLDFKFIKPDDFDGTIYPIEYVPNPILLNYEERNKRFEDLDSKFFIKIPIYNPNIFGQNLEELKVGTKEYNDDLIQRVTYTVPYMGSYNFDYKEYSGSHPGIDISAPKGTPVKNIANGVVVDVGFQQGGYGNYVLIRHDNVPLPNGIYGNIYSLYAHLDFSSAKEGNKIKRGDIIGTVGASGTATKSHLHFQIELDSSPFHPYWPFSFSQMKEKGVNFFDGVSLGLGKEDAIKNTINPLKFINDNPTFLLSGRLDNTVILSTKEIVVPKEIENNTQNEDIKVNDVKVNIDENIKKDELVLLKNQNSNIENNSNNETVKNSNGQQKIQIVKKDFEILNENLDLALIDNKDLTNLSISKIPENNNIIQDTKQDEKKIESKDILINKQEVVNIEKEKNIILKEEIQKDVLFKDIKNDYLYFKEIKYFKYKGVLKGFNDNTFRPTNQVTRAESLKIIFLSFNKNINTKNSSKFEDVKNNSWENSYINTGIDFGIISTNHTNFRPFASFTWIEALKIVLSFDKADFSLEEEKEIFGVSKNDWFYKYVNYAINNGYYDLKGQKFDKNKTISRRELIVLLYKILNK